MNISPPGIDHVYRGAHDLDLDGARHNNIVLLFNCLRFATVFDRTTAEDENRKILVKTLTNP